MNVAVIHVCCKWKTSNKPDICVHATRLLSSKIFHSTVILETLRDIIFVNERIKTKPESVTIQVRIKTAISVKVSWPLITRPQTKFE